MARLKKTEKELVRKCIAFARESVSDSHFISFDFMEFINREKTQQELTEILLEIENKY